MLNPSFTSAGAAAALRRGADRLDRPAARLPVPALRRQLADRIGGGKVTLYTFIGMTFGAAILVFAATAADNNNGKVIETGHLVGLVIGFIVLFILSGLANGSVQDHPDDLGREGRQASTDMSPTQKVVWSRSMSGALIGIAGAVGGLGGVGINLVLRASYKSNQSATAAFWIFMAFYVVAAVITWWFYVRRQTVLTTQTTDIVVEPAVTDPIAPPPSLTTAETAEQPKVSTTKAEPGRSPEGARPDAHTEHGSRRSNKMSRQTTVVVAGHGMVGHRFVQSLRNHDSGGDWDVVVIGEEADPPTTGWPCPPMSVPGSVIRWRSTATPIPVTRR